MIKYLFGILTKPKETLIGLSSNKFSIIGFIVFNFEAIIEAINFFKTDIYKIAVLSGNNEIIKKVKNLEPGKLDLVNRDIYNMTILGSLTVIITSILLFFIIAFIIKIILRLFKREITFVKILNIIGYSFFPRLCAIIIITIFSSLLDISQEDKLISWLFFTFLAVASIYTYFLFIYGCIITSRKISIRS